MMTTYRCPECGSDDLRAEVPLVVQMDGDGDCTVIDYACGNVEEINPEFTVYMTCDSCGQDGTLPDFTAKQPAIVEPLLSHIHRLTRSRSSEARWWIAVATNLNRAA